MFAVDLTNRCNLSCAMCPHSEMQRAKGDMDMAMFKKICDESLKFRMPLDWFNFYGEPLLYPQLEEALAYFSKYGMGKGVVSTNGLLLNEKNINILVRYCKNVRVAIDTGRGDVYRILRNNDRFQMVCRNIQNLIKLSKNRNTMIEIQWLRTRLNSDEGFEELEKIFGKHKHVSYLKKVCDNFIPGGPDFTIEARPKEDITKCYQPNSYFVILQNGDCILCCRDIEGKQVVGNVSENTIFEIWNGKRAERLRMQLKSGLLDELPICQECQSAWGT